MRRVGGSRADRIAKALNLGARISESETVDTKALTSPAAAGGGHHRGLSGSFVGSSPLMSEEFLSLLDRLDRSLAYMNTHVGCFLLTN
jgi:hypothetical protein